MGISDKVKDLLSSGVSPDKLSLSMAFGVTCGIFPVPGLTTVPVLLVIFLFSLNAPGTMIVNYAMTPLNIATVIPFVKAGERLMGAAPVEVGNMVAEFNEDFRAAIAKFGTSVLYGMLAWAIFLPFATLLLHLVLRVLLRKVVPAGKPAAGGGAPEQKKGKGKGKGGSNGKAKKGKKAGSKKNN